MSSTVARHSRAVRGEFVLHVCPSGVVSLFGVRQTEEDDHVKIQTEGIDQVLVGVHDALGVAPCGTPAPEMDLGEGHVMECCM